MVSLGPPSDASNPIAKTTVPAPLRTGVSYARQTGVEHDVINPNDFEFVFVEIELKA